MPFIFAFGLISCSSADKFNTDTAEGAFNLANKYEKDERYEEALTLYSDVKNKHPYSQYAVKAELKIADVYYKRESFIEAENAYKVFKDLHPKHPQIDYVTFRLGMSFYMQLPSTIDRDLSLADQAIIYYDEVIRSFPSSKYVSKAQEHKKKSLRMLAEKEDYVAEFYFIRDMFDSALKRYEYLLKNYSGLGLNAKALYGASMSAFKIKEKEKSKQYYDQLLKNHPSSKYSSQLKKDLDNVF